MAELNAVYEIKIPIIYIGPDLVWIYTRIITAFMNEIYAVRIKSSSTYSVNVKLDFFDRDN
jgi:hypothetical protein